MIDFRAACFFELAWSEGIDIRDQMMDGLGQMLVEIRDSRRSCRMLPAEESGRVKLALGQIFFELPRRLCPSWASWAILHHRPLSDVYSAHSVEFADRGEN